MTFPHVSEFSLRRRLSKRGLRLEKTPSRHWTRASYGVGYMVMDDRNAVVLGCGNRPYEASLADVVAFASV